MGYIERIGKNLESSVSIADRTSTLEMEGLRVNNPSYIVVHSTRSYPEFDQVLKSHLEKGYAGMGYHLFVGNSNTVYQGRPLLTEGAHALGFNIRSIGLGFYSADGKLDKKKIDTGRTIIQELRDRYGEIPVISHTFAQVDYINRLLSEKGISRRFNAEQDIVDPRKFESLKKDIDSFVGTLSTENHQSIKLQIKAFKNCPGPLFNHFK